VSDYEEIKKLPTGVYRVKYKRLTPSQIKTLRTRTRNKLQELKRKQNRLITDLNELDAEIDFFTLFYEDSQHPEIDEYIRGYEEQKADAEKRAETFLQSYLDEDEYSRYREYGYLELEDSLGEQWRVFSDGKALRWDKNGFREVCIIKDSTLPLPDHIVSVIKTIEEHPTSLSNWRYRR
jgi:hypothetical protein